MRLATKLTIYLSLIIIIGSSGYGYFHVLSRRATLTRMMKVEVMAIGQTLKVSLEELSDLKESSYVQSMIDAVDEYEKTLGVIVYNQEKNLLLRSRSLGGGIEPYLELIKSSIQGNQSQEDLGTYKKIPVFSYIFPIKRDGQTIGGGAILQDISFLEEDIRKAEWNIVFTILTLIGGTVTLVLLVTRKWVTQPSSQLMAAIKELAQGNLSAQINLPGSNEFSELAREFNRMSVALEEARRRLIEEVNARMELERNLRHSEKLAIIGQLSSELAHEIGTPLNIIVGRKELIEKKWEDREAAQKNLDIILRQVQRIKRIIESLLGFAQKNKPETVLLQIGDLLENTLEFMGQQIRKQGIRVIRDIQKNLPPVKGDMDLLQQVFLNLILNAVQAMPPGGTLRLSASIRQIGRENLWILRPYLEVCISDTGAGMEEEVKEKIFRSFFTTKERGTGLGLPVSLGIVQDHEGWIEVESEKWKGSVFKVFLPVPGENSAEERHEKQGDRSEG